jgi:hypothetical protein
MRFFGLSRHGRAATIGYFIARLRKALHILVVSLCCLQLGGGPLGLMQLYAWGSMLVDYSQESGLAKAVRETFSGEKPCHLCHKIDAARKNSQDEPGREAPVDILKTAKLLKELMPVAIPRLRNPQSSDLMICAFAGPAMWCGMPAEAPPSPPPRRA